MIVTKDVFDEWRKSPVGVWFFKQVEAELCIQSLEQRLKDPTVRRVDEIALEQAVQYGYVKGVLSVESLTYEDLINASSRDR